MIAAWEESGQSMKTFCRSRGIHPERLGRWRRRLGTSKPVATQEQGRGWVEAVISGAGEASTAVVVQLRSGDRIEVADPARVDAAWLSKLVSGLEEQR
jgi:transposase-like protein